MSCLINLITWISNFKQEIKSRVINEFRFDLDGHLNIAKMSRTAECLGLLPLVGRWTVDRLMVVYMSTDPQSG